MDLSKDESPVAVAQQKHFPAEVKPRPVLVASEKNNAVSANGKPRTREGLSRYKAGITSNPRPSSPKASQTPTMSRTSVSQRSQSSERRRPSTPSSPSSRRSVPSSHPSRPSPPSTPLAKSSRPSSPSSGPSTPSSPSSRSTTPVRDSMVEKPTSSRRSLVGRAPDGLWPSIRNLSASFQSESSSVLASKIDRPVRDPSPDRSLKSSANAAPERKWTLMRGRNASDQSENSRPVENSHVRSIDQLRWPAMIGGKASSNSLSTKSMDLTDKVSRSASLSNKVRGFSPTRGRSLTDAVSRSLKNPTSEVARPVSSNGSEKSVHLVSTTRNTTSVPSERTPSSIRPSRSASPAHLVSTARNTTSIPSERTPSSIRPSRSASPVPGPVRPSLPNKASATLSSISRGSLSPSRTRSSSPFSSSSNTSTRVGVSSSILKYFADVQKGKRSPSHTEDSHQLRLLHNRGLQWRFANARADAAFSTQKLIAEVMLYNVWNFTLELRDSVVGKRIDVQNLREDMKLMLILEEQISYLEDWSASEAEHDSSLSGMIDTLKASTLRLPVTGKARADMCAVKNAISSAVDVMQALGSSICFLLPRVEGTKSLVSELAEVAVTESIMLDKCRELLASTAAMQVQECSLRTHLLQLRQDVQVE